MARDNNLGGLAEKIAARLSLKSEISIIHPAELRILRGVTDKELRCLAAERGWRIVRRLGGRQIEFYNDAGTRGGQAQSEANRESESESALL
jgi:hypothetical protein